MSYFDDDDNNKFGGASDEEVSITSSDSDDEILEEDLDLEQDVEQDVEEDIEDDEDENDVEDNELQEGGEPEDIDEEDDLDDAGEKKSKRTKKIPAKTIYKKPDFDIEDDEEDDDDDGEMYLQKFDRSINNNYLVNYHPECALQNYDEILTMIKVIRDKDGIIIDDLHKTIPYLTKYEKARVLGQRAKQINSGATPFVKVPEKVIDGYLIAELELQQKRIPFIIRRPMPNGGSEYWSIKDLEDISF
jgi:DNA-directed RNA polymerase I, II, and III subunit RPABC2